MATDTDPVFRALAEDADRARLDMPADLRHRSDRRTAAQAVAGAVTVVAVVAGIIVGGGALSGGSTSDLAPVEPASPTVTVSTTPPARTDIPAAAWLSAEDLNAGEAMVWGDVESFPDVCGGHRLLPPGFAPESMTAVGIRNGTYLAPELPADYVPDGTISQGIAVFDGEQGAARLMDRVGRAVDDCPRMAGVRYSLADPALPLSSARPDDHLLIDVNEPGVDLGDGQPDPARVNHYVSVLRVGDTVTLLTLRGWEASETDLADVQRLASRATVRLLDWRNQA